MDIRYWWKPEGTQELKPTKKGVFLKLDDWEELKKSIAVIDQMLHQTHPKPKQKLLIPTEADEPKEKKYCKLDDNFNQETSSYFSTHIF